MTDDEEIAIPENPIIRELRELGNYGVNELIQWAKDGDTDAAKTILNWYIFLIERERQRKERGATLKIKFYEEYKKTLEEYIQDSIRLTLKSGNANTGFNLQEKTKNRPSLTFSEKLDQVDIACHVSSLIQEFPSKSKAYAIAAKNLNISASKARHCYETYLKLPSKSCKKL